jgi:hypothetical protein
MNLVDGLQLRAVVKDGEIKTYLASDSQRSRNVLFHWMPLSRSSEIRALLELLDNLPPEGRSLILDSGIRDGGMYLITENPAYFPGLMEWLSGAAQGKVPEPNGQPSQAPPVPASAGPIATEEGEFTKLFITAPQPAPNSVVEQPPSNGEFTRLFMQPAPTPTPAPQDEQGEFTRMFLNQDAPQKPAQPIPPPQPLEHHGEFTRLFESPLPAPAGPPNDGYAPKPEVKAPPPSDLSFTQVFGEIGAVSAPGRPKELTGVFAAPREPQVAQEPGEWTRMFAVQERPEAPAPAAVSAPEPPASEKRNWLLPLIVIVAALAVVALVLVFALTRK